MHRPYNFNHTVGVDVNYLTDCDGTEFMLFTIVDLGTTYQIQAVLREGRVTPTSLQRLDALMTYWVSWAGYPRQVAADRGLNDRGVFARALAAAGVHTANIGLEAPYQLGKVERHGDMWKTVASKVVESKSIKGMRAMTTMATEVNAVMNGMGRAG